LATKKKRVRLKGGTTGGDVNEQQTVMTGAMMRRLCLFLLSSSSLSGTSSLSRCLVSMKVVQPQVVQVYSTAGCKYCRLAKATLEEECIPFANYDIDTHALTEEESIITERIAFTRTRTVPQIFIGSELVGGCDQLLSELSDGDLDKRLLRFGVQRLQQRSRSEARFDNKDSDELAWIRPNASPYLNVFRGNASSAPLHSPLDLSVAIQSAALALTDSFSAASGESINYKEMLQSSEYARFVQLTNTLSSTRFSVLSSLPPHGKIAFWTNIYNALIIHATAALGGPADSPQARKEFFTGQSGAKYCIAGYVLSPDDIEHGFLRANAIQNDAPYFSSRPAVLCNGQDSSTTIITDQPQCSVVQHSSSDPRVGMSVSPQFRDPRVHFVLNCGARSCPPVRLLKGSSDDVEMSLSAAAAAYLDSEVKVTGGASYSARTITLPKLLLWYGADFAPTVAGVCEAVVKMMRPGPEREALADMLKQGGEADIEKAVVYGEYVWAQK